MSALLALLLTSTSGSADEPRVRLAWVRADGTDSCPNEQALSSRIRDRLGRDPFSDDAARSMEGIVTRNGTRWHARVRERDASGTLVGSRQFEAAGSDCSALADVVVLAIALAIDPQAILEPPSDPLQPLDGPLPWPESVETELSSSGKLARTMSLVSCPFSCTDPIPPASTRAPTLFCPPRPETTPSVRALEAIGILPRPALGAALSVDVKLKKTWHIQGGMALFPEVRTQDDGFAFGATLGWLGLGKAILQGDNAELTLDGSLHAGTIHSVVYTLEPTEPGDQLLLLTTAGPRMTLGWLEPIALEAGLEAIVPLIRPQFEVRERPGYVFRPDAVGALFFLGVGLTIP